MIEQGKIGNPGDHRWLNPMQFKSFPASRYRRLVHTDVTSSVAIWRVLLA
jgi:hypothetical protein